MGNIDLHTHSIYSDGTYTPAQLVAYAKERGLSALSLTDHDTIDGLDEARQQADKLSMYFINGVEINSCCYVNSKKINIHVLGYLFSPNEIRPYMQQLKNRRNEHNQAVINALQALEVNIDYTDLNNKAKNTTITNLHFAKALVQNGYAKDIKEALVKYLHKGGVAHVEYCNPPFSEVAQNIHNAGGIVSLAHPAEYPITNIEKEDLIYALTSAGLDGIECIHPSQDTLFAQTLMKLARQNFLLKTGGSDFHGINKEGIDLGVGGDGMLIPESFLLGIGVR